MGNLVKEALEKIVRGIQMEVTKVQMLKFAGVRMWDMSK